MVGTDAKVKSVTQRPDLRFETSIPRESRYETCKACNVLHFYFLPF